MGKKDRKVKGRILKSVVVNLGKCKMEKLKKWWGILGIIILENNHKWSFSLNTKSTDITNDEFKF